MMLPLFPEETMRLKRIDKNTLFALKKLFINATFTNTKTSDVSQLAAQRVAQDMIRDVFDNLETLPSDTSQRDVSENVV